MIIDAGEEISNCRLDDELRRDVQLLGDGLPELDAEAGEMPFSSKTKGLTRRVATRSDSSRGCAKELEASKQKNKNALSFFIGFSPWLRSLGPDAGQPGVSF